ncbi:MAG TPA: serine/threonine-protein kinase [Acidimicrobiales bacterium]|nr:serine/threonine-protein kinase [Acidimicrobiales bacterium]
MGSPEVIDGRYAVSGPLGRGGMAEVFRATDTATGRGVAIKLLHRVEPTSTRRFRSEIDVLARLDHPGVVKLRGWGTHDDVPYLVLDLAGGPTLADELADGALGLDRTIAAGQQVAEALVHAHALGVVHRDVKPSNILVDGAGRTRLADFGIARLAGGPSLTSTGQVVGSAPYLAPEQVAGEDAGPATDVYALGLVMIECLTGRRCYPGGQVEAAVSRLHRSPVVPPDAPAWLRDILSAMTAREPVRRPTAAAVADALRRRDADPVLATTAPHEFETAEDDDRTAPLPAGPPLARRPLPDMRRHAAAILGAALLSVIALLAWVESRADAPATRSPDPQVTSTTAAPATVAPPPPEADDGEGPGARGNDQGGNGNGRGNGKGRGNGGSAD